MPPEPVTVIAAPTGTPGTPPVAVTPPATPPATAPTAPPATPAAAPPNTPAQPATPATPPTTPGATPAEALTPAPYTFTAPDGVELDQAVIERATPILSELKTAGIPQEMAQQLVNFHASELKSAFESALSPEAIHARVQEEMTARSEQWAQETKTDPEIGGAKFADSSAAAMNAAGTVGTPAFKTLLIETGLGNNVEFVRVFAKINKLLTEDRGGLPATTTTQVKSLADRMYPKMAKD